MRVVIFDCETTGLDEQDVPISIGAIVVDVDDAGNGTIVDEWYGEQEPAVEISQSAFAVHGKDRESLSGKYFDIEQLANTVAGCSIAIAHNAAFDSHMIEKIWRGITEFEWRCSYMQWPFPRMTDRKLDTACNFFGIARDTPHNATSDATALFYALNHKNDHDETFLKLLIGNDNFYNGNASAYQSPQDARNTIPSEGARDNSANLIGIAIHIRKIILSSHPVTQIPVIGIDWYDENALAKCSPGTNFHLKLFTPPSAVVNPSVLDKIIAVHNDKWIVEIDGQGNEWLIELIKSGEDIRLILVENESNTSFYDFCVLSLPQTRT